MNQTPISEIPHRWRADRATTVITLQCRNVDPCETSASARGVRGGMLPHIDALPATTVSRIDRDERLAPAEVLEDRPGVTSQTIRCHGRARLSIFLGSSLRLSAICRRSFSEPQAVIGLGGGCAMSARERYDDVAG